MAAMTKRIAFRCSDLEYDMIKELADDNGQTVTDYIKFLILDQTEPADERG